MSHLGSIFVTRTRLWVKPRQRGEREGHPAPILQHTRVPANVSNLGYHPTRIRCASLGASVWESGGGFLEGWKARGAARDSRTKDERRLRETDGRRTGRRSHPIREDILPPRVRASNSTKGARHGRESLQLPPPPGGNKASPRSSFLPPSRPHPNPAAPRVFSLATARRQQHRRRRHAQTQGHRYALRHASPAR